MELIAENDPEEDDTTDDDDNNPDEPIEPDLKDPTSLTTQSPEKSAESSSQSVQSPPKKIDFEITNPDDIDIDDKGQLGLFS